LVDALRSWRIRGVPENPAGWVHRVAKNKVRDALRRTEVQRRVTREWVAARPAYDQGIDELFLDTVIEDSQLRMIFACCHPRLARENQLALTLKNLCGLGVPEIARALLVAEETVKKRLQRATQDLVDQPVSLEAPDASQLIERLDAVLQVLYLLFNEGYSSSRGDSAIRGDLCEDAAYLCHLLCAHPLCSLPPTRALMALMLFHAARLGARLDDHGFALLMEDQDRSQWDQRLIARAQEFLDQSATGTTISTFHLEAGIALHHCSAKTYAETDWPAILRLYDALISIHRSPVCIHALEQAGEGAALRRYHLFDATLGEFYRRAGDLERARQNFELAKTKTRSPHDHAIIERRLSKCH
jgi:RNA polymerase sigma-70 factor (ECF subfamily)